MSLSAFLSKLFTDGRPRVAAQWDLSVGELAEADRVLLDFERLWRGELPGAPPAVSRGSARYAAVTLYRACQFLVFRDVDEETVRFELGRRFDHALSPSVHYSVDLTFRFLPDIIRLARGKSREDPLVAELVTLASRWPLSSVGVDGVNEIQIDTFVEDPCLLQLYVDRIFERQDLGRIRRESERSRVCAAFLQAIGAFPDLAPEIAAVLEGTQNQPSDCGEK